MGNQNEVAVNAFTIMNIYENKPNFGEVETPFGFESFDFEISSLEIGSQTGKLHKRWTSLDFVLENAMFDITLSDEDYVEGTFSGAGLDAFEQSIGVVTGSFKARKQ